jgi:hypothetical protein
MAYKHPKSASSVFGVVKLNGTTTSADTSQAYHAALNSIAGLTTASDKMIYTSSSNTYAVTGLTATARSLLDDANTSTMRTTLGLAIGSDVQAYDADLTAIAGLAKTDGNIIVGSGSAWVAESGATARTSLGLGTGDSPAFTSVTVSGAISSSTQLATKAYVDASSGGGGASADDANTILHMSTFA